MTQDEKFMGRAHCGEAAKAAKRGEVPIGAVIASGGKILAAATIVRSAGMIRRLTPRSRPSGELAPNRKIIGFPRALSTCTIEPCAMCLARRFKRASTVSSSRPRSEIRSGSIDHGFPDGKNQSPDGYLRGIWPKNAATSSGIFSRPAPPP